SLPCPRMPVLLGPLRRGSPPRRGETRQPEGCGKLPSWKCGIGDDWLTSPGSPPVQYAVREETPSNEMGAPERFRMDTTEGPRRSMFPFLYSPCPVSTLKPRTSVTLLTAGGDAGHVHNRPRGIRGNKECEGYPRRGPENRGRPPNVYLSSRRGSTSRFLNVDEVRFSERLGGPGPRPFHIAGQAHQFHQVNEVPAHIRLPPPQPQARGPGMRVVVAVPVLAPGRQLQRPQPPDVPAGVSFFRVIQVRQAVHKTLHVQRVQQTNGADPEEP